MRDYVDSIARAGWNDGRHRSPPQKREACPDCRIVADEGSAFSASRILQEVEVEEIKGIGHITPLGGYVDWEVGNEFTPLDAVGQAIKGEAVQRVRGIATRIGGWLLA